MIRPVWLELEDFEEERALLFEAELFGDPTDRETEPLDEEGLETDVLAREGLAGRVELGREMEDELPAFGACRTAEEREEELLFLKDEADAGPEDPPGAPEIFWLDGYDFCPPRPRLSL